MQILKAEANETTIYRMGKGHVCLQLEYCLAHVHTHILVPIRIGWRLINFQVYITQNYNL